MQDNQKRPQLVNLIDYLKSNKERNFQELLKSKELKTLDFNKAEYEYFMDNCNFTDRQKQILDLRRKGLSIISISFRTDLSERTINREIRKIKNKILKII